MGFGKKWSRNRRSLIATTVRTAGRALSFVEHLPFVCKLAPNDMADDHRDARLTERVDFAVLVHHLPHVVTHAKTTRTLAHGV
jgi:hypothetical protein